MRSSTRGCIRNGSRMMMILQRPVVVVVVVVGAVLFPLLLAFALLFGPTLAWTPPKQNTAPLLNSAPPVAMVVPRRFVLTSTAASAALLAFSAPYAAAATAAAATTSSASSTTTGDDSPSSSSSSLAARLAKRDASLLQNRVFNLQTPTVQVYPAWMRGDWTVESAFSGFLFPSQTISKERLIQNYSIAGFQKCSIAATADVGKDKVVYDWSVDASTGTEDRAHNLQCQIDAYLGYPAVDRVLYDDDRSSKKSNSNPNRISIDFVDYRTVNAERIELFCNARESQEYSAVAAGGSQPQQQQPVFVCAEYLRQVTFGTGSTVGVPRQAVTNYAHFWTFQKSSDNDDNAFTGNLLTAAYLDPQDGMYFEEPTKPVAVYSHALTAKRRRSTGVV